MWRDEYNNNEEGDFIMAKKKLEIKTIEYTSQQWHERGRALYGDDEKAWKFKCPVCGGVQSVEDFLEREFEAKDGRRKFSAGEALGRVYFSCKGRWPLPNEKVREFLGGDKGVVSPCDYTAGGLFNVCKTMVVDKEDNVHSIFCFAGDRDGSEGDEKGNANNG